MADKDIHVVSLRISGEMMEKVKKISKKRRMKQSDVYRMCLGLGLDCHADMEKLGVVGVVDLFYFAREALKEKAAERKLSLPTT